MTYFSICKNYGALARTTLASTSFIKSNRFGVYAEFRLGSSLSRSQTPDSKCRAIVAPSILAADLSQLGDECLPLLQPQGEICIQGRSESRIVWEDSSIIKGHSQWFHIDIMDGHFVPNISFGPELLGNLSKRLQSTAVRAQKRLKIPFYDVHLMTSKPEEWIVPFKHAGANQITFHFEALGNSITPTRSLIRKIHEQGMRAGVAIKPSTPIDEIFPLFSKLRSQEELCDLILIMTVEPGFGGQTFNPEMLVKVTTLREMCPSLNIQVDGGLGPGNTLMSAAVAGANVIVAGTAIFRSANPTATLWKMERQLQEYSKRSLS